MASIDLQKIQKNWISRGFSFGVWNDTPGQKWENYSHEMDELFMVLGGKIELEISGKAAWCPEPGQEVFIPAHTKHSVRNIGKTHSRWLYGYRKSPDR